MRSVVAEILEWSQDRPAWQRDALRRLFSGGVGPADVAELTNLCKAARGLVESKPPTPITQEDMRAQASAATTVTLTSVTHHRGVSRASWSFWRASCRGC